ncbi:MAG: hypothetical protein WKF70_06385, partial [Chitinophagaceae bacterium]
VAVFTFSFLLLAGTLFFFRKTIIALRFVKEKQTRMANPMASITREAPKPYKQSPPVFFRMRSAANTTEAAETPFVNRRETGTSVETESFDAVKQSILLQQKQLDKLMLKLDRFETEQQTTVPHPEEANLRSKVERLELLLEEKEEALQAAGQHNEVAQMMASRLEQLQTEFNSMQGLIQGLEKGASSAAQLQMDLEDIKEEYQQLQKEHQHRQEKLQDVIKENARLHNQLSETEDKLTEANAQRQQFMKRSRLLEDLNTDFQSVSDTNSKMKNELRRVGELESMLNMMTEERDHLLRRRVH